MRRAQRVRRVLKARLPLRTRSRLAFVTIRLAIGRRRHKYGSRYSALAAPLRRDIALDLGRGRVFLGATSWQIDYEAFGDVFVRDALALPCDDEIVLDLGAHRGYFGSYALIRGAKEVYSFEPFNENYAALVAARDTFGELASSWHLEKCAIADYDGHVDLNVSTESWSHSIYAPASGEVVDAVRVPIRSFASVLAQVRSRHPTDDVVAKINVEGAAGDVILGTPIGLWDPVSCVLFDFEMNSPHPLSAVLDHLTRCGMERRQFLDQDERHPVQGTWVFVSRANGLAT